MTSGSRKKPGVSAAAAASWRSKTFDEMAAEQGIHFPQDKQAMLGAGVDLWGNDEEFEEFLTGIYERRRSPLSSGKQKQ